MSAEFLVDTSVWVDVYRGGDEALTSLVGGLVKSKRVSTTGFVLAELLRGVRSEPEFRQVVEDFGALHYIDAGSAVFLKASELSFSLRKKGRSVSLFDALIAAAALLDHQTVITRDSDFWRFPGLKVKRV